MLRLRIPFQEFQAQAQTGTLNVRVISIGETRRTSAKIMPYSPLSVHVRQNSSFQQKILLPNKKKLNDLPKVFRGTAINTTAEASIQSL